MHDNLEKRFHHLAIAQARERVAFLAFEGRFSILFAALAKELKVSPEVLAARIGWAPVPANWNAIMQGKAEPSREDVQALLDVWLEMK
jgi:hypothetical protein